MELRKANVNAADMLKQSLRKRKPPSDSMEEGQRKEIRTVDELLPTAIDKDIQLESNDESAADIQLKSTINPTSDTQSPSKVKSDSDSKLNVKSGLQVHQNVISTAAEEVTAPIVEVQPDTSEHPTKVENKEVVKVDEDENDDVKWDNFCQQASHLYRFWQSGWKERYYEQKFKVQLADIPFRKRFSRLLLNF